MNAQLSLDMATTTVGPTTSSPRDPLAIEYRELAQTNYAELVEVLLVDVECARAYLALQAAGHERADKLRRLVDEVRDGVDQDVFERWCALAGAGK